ncbi:phycobilisome protein [Cyanobacterium stanieri LEGE 03274]|uniref:Phycobilisome protein n=1 Tax=Cyanobacterium stanieri LEGE 03274 TaxID=1828756 RepID=A0ABR9V330_9CHRO|nr:phycobilisome protein [Cyanobacterium stanieri]MBE9222232.1 phycobilisome protein [Cyanobacterium stanieri LEGE 03274]
MYPELQLLIHEAEFNYLQSNDLETFSKCINSLQGKMDIYRLLRDREIEIFQIVADKLVAKFSDSQEKALEISLQHWLLITRYSAMAMLLNNPEFLERRLLEWLTDVVEARESQSIDSAVHSLLITELKQALNPSQIADLEPFLNQAKEYLVKDTVRA